MKPVLLLLLVLLSAACSTMSKSDRVELRRQRVSPAVYRRVVLEEKLSLADIVELSRKGVRNSSIIQYLYTTKTQYPLNRAEMSRLERRGVSGDVTAFVVENERPRLWDFLFL